MGRTGTPERVLECPEKPGGDMPTPLSLRQDGSLGGEGQATFLAEAGILTSDFPCSPVGEEPALSQKCRSGGGGRGRAAEAVSGSVGPRSKGGEGFVAYPPLPGSLLPGSFPWSILGNSNFLIPAGPC